MSFILDALKKSEQEGQRPNHARVVEPHPAPPRRAPLWLLAGLVAALLANAVILGWRAWPPHTPTHGKALQTKSLRAMEAPRASPAAKTLTVAPSPARKAARAPLRKASLPSAPATRPARLSARAVPLTKRTTASPTRSKPTLAAEKSAAQSAAKQNSAPVPSDAPELSQLPESFKQSVPSLTVNVHVYADTPVKRFVLINMHRYTQGQRLREGPRLLAITPNGIVLSYRGRQFRINAR